VSSSVASNSLPFGVVDTPKNGDTVGRVVDVVGWAIDDSTVAAIRIFVDGQLRSAARVTGRRPDVTSAFPQYPNRSDLHGWAAEVDLGESSGPRTILVQAVDDRGATADLRPVTVSVIGRN
jgi:hypothetical protein